MRNLVLLIATLSSCLVAEGHRLDEYFQAARISVNLERVDISLDLTPGVAIAEELLATIDPGGHEHISRHNARAYAQRVLDDLRLEIDGQPQPLKLVRVAFPARTEMREGEGTIQIRAEVRVSKLEAGRHQILFRNQHLPKLSVYSANVLIPENPVIHISQQERDTLQREYRLTFEVVGPARK